MNIGLFTDTYFPQINGVSTHVKTLKEGLEGIGHQVLVVTADTETPVHHLEDGVLRCPAVKLKRIYGYGMACIHSMDRQRILNDFPLDVIHVHTEFGIGLSGEENARRLGVPLIYTLHTMWDQYIHYIAPYNFHSFAREMTRGYIGYFAGRADEIIGPSMKVQGFLSICGSEKKVNVIPNAVELDQFSCELVDLQAVGLLKKNYGLLPEDFVICFCGRLGKEKSVDVLLDFFAEYHRPNDHIKLLIVGEGPLHKALEEKAGRLGLTGSVVFTGGIAHENMREVYACCNLYATASKSEVNSVSMLEAMAMGLPVLHILDEENPGQVTEGVNGYIFRTPEEFHSAIERFRNNREEQVRLRASTIESARLAGQETLARRVEAIYLRQLLLAGRGQKGVS